MIDDILALYPEAKLNAEPTDDSYITITYKDERISIPKKQLSKSEIKLLELIGASNKVTKSNNPWVNFFNGLSNAPADISYPLQFLYLRIQGDFDFQIWSETCISAIPELIELVDYDNGLVIGLVKDNSNNNLLMEMNEITGTLDIDFEITTSGMLGQLITAESSIYEIFQLENSLLEKVDEKHIEQNILPIANILLEIEVKDRFKDLPYLKHSFNNLKVNSDMLDTIQAMFEKQGNLSQAADSLFIHRNTLLYRINKFQKDTGFNLQYLPDLLVCYFYMN